MTPTQRLEAIAKAVAVAQDMPFLPAPVRIGLQAIAEELTDHRADIQYIKASYQKVLTELARICRDSHHDFERKRSDG